MTGDTVTSGVEIDSPGSPFNPAIPLGPALPVCYKLFHEINNLVKGQLTESSETLFSIKAKLIEYLNRENLSREYKNNSHT